MYIPHHKCQVRPASTPFSSASCTVAIAHRNHFFRLSQKNKPSASKVKFRQPSNTKEKCLSFILNLTHMIFGELLIVFSRNVNLLYRIYLMLLRCCLLHLTNKIVENFSQNSTLEDLGISLLVFHATTTLNLHNILVTPTLVKIVITNLDLSKASSSDCVLVVVLKNCESEVS